MRLTKRLEKLDPYVAGTPIWEVKERYRLPRIVKLASNEAPWPPPAAALAAIERELAGLNRYPDSQALALREALARANGLDSSQVVVGNGSGDLLFVLASAVLEPGDEVIYASPSFLSYEKTTYKLGAVPVPVPLTDDGYHDLEAMAGAVGDKTGLLILCNPNNPTGTYHPAERLQRFLSELPAEVTVMIDGAYLDFVNPPEPLQTSELLKTFPNLIVLRTFSKIYGLAGLRVGYALCGAPFTQAYDRLRPPFNVNALAQAAALAALTEEEEITRRRQENALQRTRLEAGLSALGLKSLPSQANFLCILVRHLSIDDVVLTQKLMEKGLIVRSGTKLGLPGTVRLTVGSADENDFCLEVLREVL